MCYICGVDNVNEKLILVIRHRSTKHLYFALFHTPYHTSEVFVFTTVSFKLLLVGIKFLWRQGCSLRQPRHMSWWIFAGSSFWIFPASFCVCFFLIPVIRKTNLVLLKNSKKVPIKMHHMQLFVSEISPRPPQHKARQ